MCVCVFAFPTCTYRPRDSSTAVRAPAQASLLLPLLRASEQRLRLQAFLEAHTATTHTNSPVDATMSTHSQTAKNRVLARASMTAFLGCVRRHLAHHDRAMQLLQAAPSVSHTHVAKPTVRGVMQEGVLPQSERRRPRMTLLQLVLRVQPWLERLGLLAGICRCTPAVTQQLSQQQGTGHVSTWNGWLGRFAERRDSGACLLEHTHIHTHTHRT